jgi:hypothetical protein
MKTTKDNLIIGIFLVLGTLFALYIGCGCLLESIQYYELLWMRAEIVGKIVLIILGLDLIFLNTSGIISCTSFFKKGTIWKPLIKAIILNVAILLLIVCITICDFKLFPGLSVITTTITGALLWCLFSIYKITKRL